MDDRKVVDMGHGVWTDDGDHYLCGPAHHTPEYIDALEAEVARLTREHTYLYQAAVRELLRSHGGFNIDQAARILDTALATLEVGNE